jgi:DNA-binding transcriptional ArsR family regulator
MSSPGAATYPSRDMTTCHTTAVMASTIVKYMPKRRAAREPVDEVLHALADPSRRRIVERLSHAPATVSELAAPLAMSLPAVHQHLQVLETSGLVTSEKVGRVRTCRVQPAALGPVERWLVEQRSTWERRLDRLGEYLDRT